MLNPGICGRTDPSIQSVKSSCPAQILFGTFLDTFRQLESARTYGRGGWPEKEVLLIAKTVAASPEAKLPLKEIMARANLPQDAFLGALVAGRDKNLFEIDDSGDQPILSLTKIGRTIAA